MPGTAVEVRCATEWEPIEIWQLAHDEYTRNGLTKPRENGMFSHFAYLEFIPETTRLVALENEKIVGTLTYTLDGQQGLYTDVDYPKETQRLRETEVKLFCVWRLVTSRNCRSTHRVFTELMRTTASRLMAIGEPTILIEVHPRHVKYYVRRLGFSPIGERDNTTEMSNAPSVLMVGGKGSYRRLITGDVR